MWVGYLLVEEKLYPIMNRTLLKSQSQYFASATAGAKKAFEVNAYNEYFPFGSTKVGD